jgi:hypothetical protein
VSEQEKKQFIHVFDPVRPELVTDAAAWTEEDTRIAHDHVAYLRKATEQGIVILADRSIDGEGPAIVILEADTKPRRASSWRMTPLWLVA